MIERPLDLLNSLKGKEVFIELGQKIVKAQLLAFDIHINLAVSSKKDGLVFIRGDNVISIKAVDNE